MRAMRKTGYFFLGGEPDWNPDPGRLARPVKPVGRRTGLLSGGSAQRNPEPRTSGLRRVAHADPPDEELLVGARAGSPQGITPQGSGKEVTSPPPPAG